MPDIPEDAVQATAEVLLRDYASQYNADHLTWRDFADLARAAVEAAAPILAEAVARKILDHMEAHGPPESGRWHVRNAWRRHFHIAAQVAHFSFSTEVVNVKGD